MLLHLHSRTALRYNGVAAVHGVRDLAEGPYFLVWVRGLTGPQPEVWGEVAFYGPVAERERVALAVRALQREEAVLPLRELAARCPALGG